MKKYFVALVATTMCLVGFTLPANATPTVSPSTQTEQVGNDCEIRAFRPYSFQQGSNVTIRFRVAYTCWPKPRWMLVVDQGQRLVGAVWKNVGKAEIRTLPKTGDTIVAEIDCTGGVFRTVADLTNEKGADHSVSPIANISCNTL